MSWVFKLVDVVTIGCSMEHKRCSSCIHSRKCLLLLKFERRSYEEGVVKSRSFKLYTREHAS